MSLLARVSVITNIRGTAWKDMAVRLAFSLMVAIVAAPLYAFSYPYVRVLLPVYIVQPVPGAYGSLWTSQFVIHNESVGREYILQTLCPPPSELCVGDVAADEDLNPQQTKLGLPSRYSVPANPVAGAVVWLSVTGAPYDDGDDVAYDLRVVDLSRSATAAGTEIPVVRENALRKTVTSLLNVPVDARFRLSLRLFELNLAQADFMVRILDQDSGALLSQQRVTTTTGDVAPGGFTPGFVELANFAGGTQARRVRAEIEPLTAGVAFWSYVSITNNDSQQITLVTPQ